VTWRSELLQSLQKVRANCKTRNQLIDKRPSLAAKHKTGFPPHEGGLQAEGRFDFAS